MAITASAKKAERAGKRRRVFNTRRKKAVHDTLKETGKLITAKKGKDAAQSLTAFYKAVDKAAKHGTLSRNTAARMKSRAAKRVAAIAK